MISAKLVKFFIFATQATLAVGQWGWKGEMMDVIHNLLDHQEAIERFVTDIDVGIESYTYSGDSDVASWIQTHVEQMATLMDSEYGRIRMWDDIFEKMFALRDSHEMEVTNTNEGSYGGVRVVHKVADDVDSEKAECTKATIQKHAQVVSKFVDRGRKEMHTNHPAPTKCG